MAISRQDILATGIALLRQYGLADLSMRRIAKELEVAPGALYWHVKNKQALLVLIARELTSLPAQDDNDGGALEAAGMEAAGMQKRALQPVSEAGQAHAEDPVSVLVLACASQLRNALQGIPDAADVVQLAYALDDTSVAPLVVLREGLDALQVAHSWALSDAVAFIVLGELMARQARAFETRDSGSSARGKDAMALGTGPAGYVPGTEAEDADAALLMLARGAR